MSNNSLQCHAMHILREMIHQCHQCQIFVLTCIFLECDFHIVNLHPTHALQLDRTWLKIVQHRDYKGSFLDSL